ncbi:MAG: hypothetical protein ACI9X4_001655, partial [Glaciecola sp.]
MRDWDCQGFDLIAGRRASVFLEGWIGISKGP